MKRTESVLFRGKDGHDELLVTRVSADQIKHYAQAVLRVMGIAYERQFGQELGMLPEGAARQHFNHLSPSRVNQQTDRMEAYTAQGSQYWVARVGRYVRGPHEIVGVAKVSPSRPGWRTRLGITPPGLDNCYVNDIAVTEPRAGVGSTLLHTALHDFGPNRRVVADVLPGSEAFFDAAGFQARQPQLTGIGHVEIGEHTLPTRRFEAVGALMVRQSLESVHGWLAEREALDV